MAATEDDRVDEQTELKGADTVKGVIAITPGVLIDDKLKLGGVKWLEKKFGKPFQDIADEFATHQSMTNMSMIIVALFRQRHPDMTDDQCEQEIDKLDIEDIGTVIGKLSVFNFEPKNSDVQTEKPTETEATTEAG
jgi:hypothetical protein